MKITKSELKQLIQEELKIISEQQSESDREAQAELEKAANLQALVDKYGSKGVGKDSTTKGVRKMIDLLTDIKGLMTQLVQKP